MINISTYHNFKIKDVPEDDLFIADVVEKFYWQHSQDGFLLGELYGIQRQVSGEDESSEPLGQRLEKFYSMLENYIGDYIKIENKIRDKWKEQGSPMSLLKQKRLKEYYDREDRFKEEFYDR